MDRLAQKFQSLRPLKDVSRAPALEKAMDGVCLENLGSGCLGYVSHFSLMGCSPKKTIKQQKLLVLYIIHTLFKALLDTFPFFMHNICLGLGSCLQKYEAPLSFLLGWLKTCQSLTLVLFEVMF